MSNVVSIVYVPSGLSSMHLLVSHTHTQLPSFDNLHRGKETKKKGKRGRKIKEVTQKTCPTLDQVRQLVRDFDTDSEGEMTSVPVNFPSYDLHTNTEEI
jgi:hypothetical protein